MNQGDIYAAQGFCYSWLTADQKWLARVVIWNRCMMGQDAEFNSWCVV